MGGRGVNGRGGGGGGYRGGKDDTPIVWYGDGVGITEKAHKTLGDANSQRAAEYIKEAIGYITGNENYADLSIDGSATGNAYAHMQPATGEMGINPKLFKSLKELEKTYKDDLKAGFHPKGTKAVDIFVHEAGHRLDYLIAVRNGLKKMTSTEIVPLAIKEVNKARVARGEKRMTAYEMQDALSGYGSGFYKNHTGDAYVETFAEAMADYNRNKGKANELSREIMRQMRLKGYI